MAVRRRFLKRAVLLKKPGGRGGSPKGGRKPPGTREPSKGGRVMPVVNAEGARLDREVYLVHDAAIETAISGMGLERRFGGKKAGAMIEAFTDFMEHPRDKGVRSTLERKLEKITGSMEAAKVLIKEFVEQLYSLPRVGE